MPTRQDTVTGTKKPPKLHILCRQALKIQRLKKLMTTTYTKLLPGSTVVQVVSYLGYKLGGWLGSAVATAAFVLPSALLMLVLAAAYVSVTAVPVMRPAIGGLTAAVVGILLATTYRLSKANIPDRITLGIALASIVAGAVLGISAALIVVAAGLLGVCLYALPLGQQAAQGDAP
jgi:chromate transporter